MEGRGKTNRAVRDLKVGVGGGCYRIREEEGKRQWSSKSGGSREGQASTAVEQDGAIAWECVYFRWEGFPGVTP
jgi:hypothetical protein